MVRAESAGGLAGSLWRDFLVLLSLSPVQRRGMDPPVVRSRALFRDRRHAAAAEPDQIGRLPADGARRSHVAPRHRPVWNDQREQPERLLHEWSALQWLLADPDSPDAGPLLRGNVAEPEDPRARDRHSHRPGAAPDPDSFILAGFAGVDAPP